MRAASWEESKILLMQLRKENVERNHYDLIGFHYRHLPKDHTDDDVKTNLKRGPKYDVKNTFIV